MPKNRPFFYQIIIVGGFLIFLFIFFALTKAVYRDYRLDLHIQSFEDEIDQLADLAHQKPRDVLYYQSSQYKDKIAKESMNLLNPGEKLIIIPQERKIVRSEVIIDRFDHGDVLFLPNQNQWWEYFFGSTLSLKTQKPLDSAQDKLDSQSVEQPESDNGDSEEPADGEVLEGEPTVETEG
jgi:hypothetical protein